MFGGESKIERVRSTAGFAEKFSALGPRDSRGGSARYAKLLPADREAIIEILVATKAGLPDYFSVEVR